MSLADLQALNAMRMQTSTIVTLVRESLGLTRVRWVRQVSALAIFLKIILQPIYIYNYFSNILIKCSCIHIPEMFNMHTFKELLIRYF